MSPFWRWALKHPGSLVQCCFAWGSLPPGCLCPPALIWNWGFGEGCVWGTAMPTGHLWPQILPKEKANSIWRGSGLHWRGITGEQTSQQGWILLFPPSLLPQPLFFKKTPPKPWPVSTNAQVASLGRAFCAGNIFWQSPALCTQGCPLEMITELTSPSPTNHGLSPDCSGLLRLGFYHSSQKKAVWFLLFFSLALLYCSCNLL